MAFPSSPYVNSAQARSVKDELNLRMATLATPLTASESFDSNGNPVLTIAPTSGAAWATGQQYAVVRFNMVSSINVDALGLTQTVYTPMWIQVCVEGNTTGTGAIPATSDFNSVLGWTTEAALMGTLVRVGARVSVYNSGHGVQPAVAGITGNPVANFDDLLNPLTSSR